MKKLCQLLLYLFCTSLIYSQAGSLDPSFSGNGKVKTLVGTMSSGQAVAIQADQKIVVAGYYDVGFAAIRYLPDGTLDASFGNAGITLIPVGLPAPMGVAIQPDDGKIVIVGKAAIGSDVAAAVVRLTTDGVLDNTFNGNGIILVPHLIAYSVGIQSNKKIVVACNYASDFVVLRFHSNGTPDDNFGSGGEVITQFATHAYMSQTSLCIQPDGKIVVAANRDYDCVAMRYNSNGSLDPTFGIGGITYFTGGNNYLFSTVSGVALQLDNKILFVGCATTDQPRYTRFLVVRLNSNGTLDNTFSSNGKATVAFNNYAIAFSIVQQTNGKIVAVGFTIPQDDQGNDLAWRFAICRLDGNGSLDANFGNGGKVTTNWPNSYDDANAVALQSNGRIVVAGESGYDFAVARYFATGTNQPDPPLTQQSAKTMLQEETKDLQVFPNPAENILQVKFSPQNSSAILSIVDASGKKLMTQMIDGKNNCVLDITKLAIGNYYLVLTLNGKQQSIPIVKSR